MKHHLRENWPTQHTWFTLLFLTASIFTGWLYLYKIKNVIIFTSQDYLKEAFAPVVFGLTALYHAGQDYKNRRC